MSFMSGWGGAWQEFTVVLPSQHTPKKLFKEVIGAFQQTKVNGRSPKSLGSFPLLSAYVPTMGASQQTKVNGRSPKSLGSFPFLSAYVPMMV